MQRFVPIISVVLFLGGILGVILPAFFSESTFKYAMITLSLLLLIGSLYTFVMIVLFVKTPLTIVKTIIRIKVSEDLKRAEFKRTQIIRANRPDVTAYYTSASPSTKSRKIFDFESTIFCPGAGELVNNTELFGDESSGFEVIQSFGRTLRYRWFMPLIPSFLLQREDITTYLGFIGRNLTRRTQSCTYIDEFDCDQPRFDFRAVEYHQHNFEVEIAFEGSVPPSLKVRRLKPIGVTDVPTFTSGVQKNVVTFKVKSLYKEKIRAYSSNPKQLFMPDLVPMQPSPSPVSLPANPTN